MSDKCEAYGVAYSSEDSECDGCGDSEKCEELTEGEKPLKKKAGKTTEKTAKKKKVDCEDPDTGEDESPDGGEGDDVVESQEDSLDGMEIDEKFDVIAGRLSTVIGLLNRLVEGSPPTEKDDRSSKRKANEGKKADKEIRKANLLANGPYDSDGLAELTGRDIKMLASAMKLNSFGMTRDEAVKLISTAQKKSAPKSGGKKSGGKKKTK